MIEINMNNLKMTIQTVFGKKIKKSGNKYEKNMKKELHQQLFQQQKVQKLTHGIQIIQKLDKNKYKFKIIGIKQFQLIFLSQYNTNSSYKYFICKMILNQLLEKLQKIQNNRELLRKTCKINQLPITMLNGFTNTKIQIIYQRLLKHYLDHPEKAKTIWFENELKIFFWVVISISLLENKRIQDFQDQQWLYIKSIFTQKDLYTFKYESKKILSSGRKNSRVWNQQQNSLLKEIMSDSKIKNKWNQVARVFYQRNGHKYFRTGKQCREHWLNHLDPSKKHGKWDPIEDLKILQYVFSNGKKWSLIAKELITNRTEHMIKNRYKALLFKEKKNANINQFDENKLLRKIIKKYSYNQGRQSSEKQKSQVNQVPNEQFSMGREIVQQQKIMENFVSMGIREIPPSNFNYINFYPFLYFYPQGWQIVGNFGSNNQVQVEIQSSIDGNKNDDIKDSMGHVKRINEKENYIISNSSTNIAQ